MQYFKNEGTLVGVFDFPTLKFEEGNCPRSEGLVTQGKPKRGIKDMIPKSRVDPISK